MDGGVGRDGGGKRKEVLRTAQVGVEGEEGSECPLLEKRKTPSEDATTRSSRELPEKSATARSWRDGRLRAMLG